MPRIEDNNSFNYQAKLDRQDRQQERRQKANERKLLAALNSCSRETKQNFADILSQ
jgi:hypothetical protein